MSEREILVVGSKIKNYLKERGLKSSGDLVEAVSAKVQELLDHAIRRAQDNKRSTVRPCDL